MLFANSDFQMVAENVQPRASRATKEQGEAQI